MKCPRMIIKLSGLKSDIQKARKDTNINPTEAQINAENYKKGSFKWNGLNIKIENPKGSIRSGTADNGKKWSIEMKYGYGYISNAQDAKDGDKIDIFIGDHPESQIVFVIDQMFKGKFDEHKCVIGALTEEEAKKTYLANYEKGWTGLGAISYLTVDQFKEWAKKGNTKKPVKGQSIKVAITAGELIPKGWAGIRNSVAGVYKGMRKTKPTKNLLHIARNNVEALPFELPLLAVPGTSGVPSFTAPAFKNQIIRPPLKWFLQNGGVASKKMINKYPGIVSKAYGSSEISPYIINKMNRNRYLNKLL